MIFSDIKTEQTVQEKDKTRIDVSGSFAEGETITSIEVDPDTSGNFYVLNSKNIIDWAYNTEGTKTITVKIVTDLNTELFTKEITIISAASDNLLSNDSELVAIEDDVMSYLRAGRNSYLDKHRVSQSIILDELDSKRIWKDSGERYTAADLVDIQDFKTWSIYLTLWGIYESLINQPDDVFSAKSTKYKNRAIDASKRSIFRLDSNEDGAIDIETEIEDNFTSNLVLR